MRSVFDLPRNSLRSLGLAILSVGLLAGGTPTAETRLNALQTRYDAIDDLRASFVQHSFTASLGREEVARGQVIVQRPGKIRWSYDPPDGRVIVLDGETLRIYSPEDGQLQIAALQPGTVSPTALDFLMGQGRLAEDFTAELVAAERAEVGLRLVPRADASFESLVFWLDPKTHELRESVLVDLFGNRTRLELRDATSNAGVRGAEFKIDVPDDTEIIDLR